MSKPKLTDSQLVILNKAAQAGRALGAQDLAGLKAKGAALAKTINSLLKRGLLEEVTVKPRAECWRKDEAGKCLGLVITSEGLAAIGIETSAEPEKPKRQSKQEQLIELLSGDGCTVSELGEALCWLPHTVRAALTRLRQRGFAIERINDDGPSRYRITANRKAA